MWAWPRPAVTWQKTGRVHPSNVTLLPLLLSLPAEELCLELSRAIEAGDARAASRHASSLARQGAALSVQLSEKNYADGEIK